MKVYFLCEYRPYKYENNLDRQGYEGGNNGGKPFEDKNKNHIHKAVRNAHRKKLAEDYFRYSAELYVKSVVNAGGKNIDEGEGRCNEQFALPVESDGKDRIVPYDETFVYRKRHKRRDYKFEKTKNK